ncbi:grx4 family monothiol glutaredoxin [Pyrenophora seminiperda CCB06]|uniref:Monothiol glutaredoxin-5, mitochondrial n=1 Tax=Pyrenophora seminiperda CCB06 TaxID=1302712 RepID=A0A3M7LVB1_9PLEO|nr:grx4 family monothiol glutaredoxin [Pyrenophora seminiperda CCB06]
MLAFRAATRVSAARPIPSARFLTPFQARLLSAEVRSAIDKAVASAPVVLFMKGTPETPQCGFSRASIQILGMQGVDPEKFTAFNVLEDQELRQGIKEYSEWPTIPQLYVDKEFIGGCDILMSMHQDGSLAKMLEEKGVRAFLAAANMYYGPRLASDIIPSKTPTRSLHSVSMPPKMGVEDDSTALRTRGNISPPVKTTPWPLHAKKTISAALVFKNRYTRKDQGNSNTQAHSNGSRHLYRIASRKINKTLENTLQSLYESTLQTTTPSGDHQQGSNASPPPKLSASAKYHRLALQLHQPISQFRLSLRRTTSEGKIVRIEQTLETRMQHYKELIAEQRDKLAKLQKAWEMTVAEIWKLGTTCLGEENMKNLLFTKQRLNDDIPLQPPPPSSPPPPLPSSSSSSNTTDVESTLFVPEQGTSTPIKKPRARKRKHVAFLDEGDPEVSGKCNTGSASEFPAFIYQASKDQDVDVPITVPMLWEKEAKEFNQRIEELGNEELEAFRKMDKEHQAFWKRKTAQVAVVLEKKDD